MDRQLLSQGFPILLECYFCGLLFANNHRCPAKDKKCSKCNEFGHYSGFCLQWNVQPLAETSNNITKYRDDVKNNFNNSQETFRKNMRGSLDKHNKENQRERADRNTISEVSNDDIQELMPKKKRFRGMAVMSNLENTVAVECESSNEKVAATEAKNAELKKSKENIEKKLAAAEAKNAELEKSKENIKEKLVAAEAKIAELAKNLDCEVKLVAQYQDKLKMYRNTPLNKTHNKLMEQLETEKKEVAQLTEQRDELFAYVLKIESHNKVVEQRFDDLFSEQRELVTGHYAGYISEKLPNWLRDCKYCGSTIAHLWEDCVAQGNVCKICGITNHFTAMCSKADVAMSDTAEEQKLVDSLKETIKVKQPESKQPDVMQTKKKKK